jgi:hypothetical protein
MANIELDGANKKIKVDSGDLTLDVPGDIVLDADGGDVVVADGGTNILKVTNSSSDVVLQPQVDAKDIIFKQFDGTTVATVEDNGTFNIPASKLAIGDTAVTSTAAELNILDGVTATASELNLLDGGTSVGSSITLADADGVVVNDGGTMKTIPASDVKTYVGGGLFTQVGHTSISASQTINVDNVFSSTYKNYMVIIEGWSHQNSTSQLYFGFRTGTSGSNADGGSTIGGVSAGRLRVSGSDPSFMGNDAQNDAQVRLTTDVYNNEYSSLQMYVFNPYVTSRRSTISGRAPYREGSTGLVGFTDFGHLSISTEQHTGFKVYTQGSFNSGGTITVYGMTDGS